MKALSAAMGQSMPEALAEMARENKRLRAEIAQGLQENDLLLETNYQLTRQLRQTREDAEAQRVWADRDDRDNRNVVREVRGLEAQLEDERSRRLLAETAGHAAGP